MVRTRPHVVTLGTAGGPRWWRSNPVRAGIATAVVVGDAWYLVDAGTGVGRQITQADLPFEQLRGIFVTHMHSDHTVDLLSLLLFGVYELENRADTPVHIIGPGDRGALPPTSSLAATPPRPVAPHLPTPGITDMVRLLVESHAADVNDRVLDSLRASPADLFAPRDIALPGDIGYHSNENPTPGMAPFVVHADDRVRVTATLVLHPPVAPAFAFRFDTDEGSVTISGDTAPCDNLVRLAADTDLLLHEAIDLALIDRNYVGVTDPIKLASQEHLHKSHTDIQDTARIARDACARALALHHLVPGVGSAEQWRPGEQGYTGRILVPDDLDVIEFGRG